MSEINILIESLMSEINVVIEPLISKQPIEISIPGVKGDTGDTGATGNGIVLVVRTSGTGAAGTTDTYTITFTDLTTTTFNVYNGADGLDAGDMLKSVYDTDGDGKVNSAVNADTVNSLTVQTAVPSGAVFTDNQDASEVPYSNTTSGLTATNVQTAIDEVVVEKVQIYNNAGFHNSIFRGKYLGSSVTEAQYTAISSGTFEDLYIGDYWTIGGVNYRIAAFNYYYNTGDTDFTTNHAVIVPDGQLYTHVMNDTNITTGAYVGSKMYVSGLNSAKTTINAAFIGHVRSYRNYLHNAVTSGYASGGAWYDSTVDLMTEANVYGTKHYGNATQGTNLANNIYVDKSQFPLFALNPQSINNRQDYWLRDVASSTTFAAAGGHGLSRFSGGSVAFGVRPAFCIS